MALLFFGGHRGLGMTDTKVAQDRIAAEKLSLPAENTLQSLLGALRQGANFIETDAIVTADGEIVLTHSNDPGAHIFNAAYKIPGKNFIDEMTLQEVKSLRIGADGNGRIPTLRELLRAIMTEFPGNSMVLNLELKGIQATPRETSKATPLIKCVLDTIRQENFPLERILFSSFSLNTMKELARLEPKARAGMIFYTAPPGSSYADTVLYDDGSEAYSPFTADSIRQAVACLPKLEALIPEIRDVTPESVRLAAQNKLAIITYGYPEESPYKNPGFALAARQAQKLCRDNSVNLGLMTDYLADMKRFTRENTPAVPPPQPGPG